MILDKNFLQPQWNANRTLLGYWGLAIFLLLIGTFVPFTDIIHNLFFLDTLVHLVLYSMLSFIPLVLFRSRKTAFLFSIAMTPIGYLLELLHMMVMGSDFSVINALANNVGVIAGIAAGFIVRLKSHYERDQTKA